MEWYRQNKEELLSNLNTNMDSGLPKEEVENRLKNMDIMN